MSKIWSNLKTNWNKHFILHFNHYWCLGIYLIADEDGIHKMDHLESVSGDATNWSRPRTDDVQNVRDIQILQVDVQGEWNFRKRTPTFVVGNREEINEIFQNYYKL